jgi:Tfp pilus assembly protein PilO
MKITPLQQYLILGVLAFLGLSYLYYQFLLKPLNKNIADLRVTLEEQQKELDNARKIAEKYEEFKKRADTVQRELEWFQSRIPKTIEQTTFVEKLNLIQNRSGIIYTKFEFRDVIDSKDGAYKELPVNMTFFSSYKGLLDFLYQIEISNLFMTVRELTIKTRAESSNPDSTIEAQMLVSGVQAK